MAVQPGLCLTWSETPKTGFLPSRIILFLHCRLADILTYKNAERENKVLAMEAQASNVAYPTCSRLSNKEDKENIRQSSKKDASVLRDTTQSSNVSGSSDEDSSIHTLIEKMNQNLGVGVSGHKVIKLVFVLN